MHVLICDDDPDMQFLLKYILTIHQNQVTQAMNKKDVLSNSQNHFDLIIMDYFLGDDHGLDVLAAFRKISYHECPVILLSGQEFKESPDLKKEYNLLDIIQKPFDPAWFSEYIKRLRLS